MKPWPVVGHQWAVRQLQTAIERDEVPHALLISGPDNVGKMTLARLVAGTLLCKGQSDERPCGVCLACRKLASGSHPDFMPVEPEAEGGALKIDQIRAVERFLALTPNESARKIALINAFEERFSTLWDTGRDGTFERVKSTITTAGTIPLVFDASALTHDEVTSLKRLIRDNCPAADSAAYRQDAAGHQSCPRGRPGPAAPPAAPPEPEAPPAEEGAGGGG